MRVRCVAHPRVGDVICFNLNYGIFNPDFAGSKFEVLGVFNQTISGWNHGPGAHEFTLKVIRPGPRSRWPMGHSVNRRYISWPNKYAWIEKEVSQDDQKRVVQEAGSAAIEGTGDASFLAPEDPEEWVVPEDEVVDEPDEGDDDWEIQDGDGNTR